MLAEDLVYETTVDTNQCSCLDGDVYTYHHGMFYSNGSPYTGTYNGMKWYHGLYTGTGTTTFSGFYNNGWYVNGAYYNFYYNHGNFYQAGRLYSGARAHSHHPGGLFRRGVYYLNVKEFKSNRETLPFTGSVDGINYQDGLCRDDNANTNANNYYSGVWGGAVAYTGPYLGGHVGSSHGKHGKHGKAGPKHPVPPGPAHAHGPSKAGNGAGGQDGQHILSPPSGTGRNREVGPSEKLGDEKGKKNKKNKKGKSLKEPKLPKGPKGPKGKEVALNTKHSQAAEAKLKLTSKNRPGFIISTGVVALIMVSALLLITRRTHTYHEVVGEPNERKPLVPIPLRAFGTFPNASMTAAELDAAVADMRIPPPRSPMVHDARSPIVYDARSPLRPSRGSGRRQLPPLHMTMETDLDALAETPLVL